MKKLKKWTKRELTLRPGVIELAKAVIEQWKADGCPQSDLECIKYWQSIIDTYSKD